MTAETEINDDGSQAEAQRVFQLAIKQPFAFNEHYRLVSADIPQLLEFAQSAKATNADVRLWYANGSECRDRPGVLASFHPLIHKREGEWPKIHKMASELAKDLGRWVWLTLGEDRWVRVMVGPDPSVLALAVHGDAPRSDPLTVDGQYQNDQYITTFSPTGEERFIGCS